MDVRERFRTLSELLADPALTVYKNAAPAALSPAACSVLLRHSRLLLDHCWGLIERTYGVRRGAPFCVVYQGTRLCTMAVTPDAERAVQVASQWYGTRPSIAVVVGDTATVFELNDRCELLSRSTVVGLAERWLVLPAALVYTPPAWLGRPPPPPLPPQAAPPPPPPQEQVITAA